MNAEMAIGPSGIAADGGANGWISESRARRYVRGALLGTVLVVLGRSHIPLPAGEASPQPPISASPSAEAPPSRAPAASDPCDQWQGRPATQKLLVRKLRAVAAADLVGKHVTPGGTIAVGRGGAVLACVGYGKTGDGQPVSPTTTEYDLASASKLVTATAVMMLKEQGFLRLDQPVGDFLPAYNRGTKAVVTFRQVLEHRSGLIDPRYSRLTHGTKKPAEVWQRLLSYPLQQRPGSTYSYSNVGFNVLWAAAGRAAGEPLNQYIEDNLFKPLGMRHTAYAPQAKHCAPTSPDPVDSRDSTNNLAKIRLCQPQDNLALKLGGKAGNAGIFSTAYDMGRFAAMLANGGTLDGRRYLQPPDIRLMRMPQALTVNYGLGTRTNQSGLFSDNWSPDSFGHTGHTGTVVAIDPATKFWSVDLTNATFHRPAPTTASYSADQAINNALLSTMRS